MKLRNKGVRPYGIVDKDFSQPIWQASLPAEAVVPLLQHQGESATALVNLGDEVREGLLIGRASESDGAGVHSPIPGVVQGLVDIDLPSGQRCPAVSIKLRGQFDYLGKQKTESDWRALSPLALIDRISEKGLVHMDSFTEPLGSMLKELRKHGAGSIIINAASGAPFSASELRLCRENPAEILKGIQMLQKILSSDDVYFVYTRRYRPYVHAVRQEAAKAGLRIKFHPLRDSYSAGDPLELIHMVTGKELLPEDSYASSGAGVFAVSTVHALFEAVALGKALVDRLITVGGGAIKKTRTVRVRIGTSLAAVFEELGENLDSAAKVLAGNPLQGYEVTDLNTPVTKQIASVTVLTAEELGEAQEQPCIHCGLCVESCPADIEPVTLHKLLKQNRLPEARQAGLMACRICGLCSHVCPSRIPLTGILRDGIVAVQNLGENNDATN